ncbi:uncharacterized protein N7459_001135 [Penicillium hispanicum]|uniref:uncharacterized protein n=1 Tax=Penicillium hispanicum TaxID=1080232 RepID=UPI00253F908E|nr:uncharacterized protein N7459_001135 [Penicillium hispanicum]KAJ5594927.1 hypothetical protein N7459_001135 [Penicillium hispanicum]
MMTTADSTLSSMEEGHDPMAIDDVSARIVPSEQADPSPSEHPDRPLLQRLGSSGIDMTGFSFAKPATHRKGFALRSMPAHSLIRSIAAGDLRTSDAQTKPAGVGDQVHGIQDRSLDPRVDAEVQYRNDGIFSERASDLSSHGRFNSPEAGCGQELEIIEVPHTNPKYEASLGQHRAIEAPQQRNGTTSIGESTPRVDTGPIASRPSSSQSIQIQNQRSESIPGPPLVAPTRSKGDGRIPKRRREGQKAVPLKRQISAGKNMNGTQQLTEDKLFELLIGKIRQREESEAAAAETQLRMEAQNVALKDQNQSLQHQLEIYETRMHKSAAEVKAYQSQIETWKANVRKFKHVVDELGHDYESLRGENQKLKSVTESLDNEKNGLMQDIDSIKAHISRAERTMDEQRTKISDGDHKIALLEQALENSEDKGKSIRNKLSDEKKRTATLEFYIKASARNQTRQLGLMRAEQSKLIQTVTSGFDSIEKTSISSREAIVSETGSALQGCCSSIQSLNETCAARSIDIQQFTEKAQNAISQINCLSAQFTASLEESTKANFDVRQGVQEGLEAIKGHVGSESLLLKQLCSHQTSCDRLKERLELIEPTLSNIDNSVGSLILTENNLVQDLGDFGKRLAKAQIPEGPSALEKEIVIKFTENSQLQLRLQEASYEIKSLTERLSENETTNQGLKQSLVDATAQIRTAADLNLQLESKLQGLQREVESTEQRVRGELDEERTSLVNRINAQYQVELDDLENELGSAVQERDHFQTSVAELVAQLEGVHQSLDEANRLMNEHKTTQKSLMDNAQKQIEQLSQSCSASTSQLQAKTAEVERYQKAETTSRAENARIREQLQQAQEKIQALEQRPIPSGELQSVQEPLTSNIVPFATIEGRLSPDRPVSPYNDPGDFAMLFMSDDPFSLMSLDKEKSNDLQENLQYVAKDDQPEGSPTNKTATVPTGSPQGDQIQAKGKRKGVNFEPEGLSNEEEATTTSQPASTQPQRDIGEAPSKLSKHVHKWTYSRVHSSATQIQEEQSTAPVHVAAGERRPSPKGLVSASSGRQAGSDTMLASIRKAEYFRILLEEHTQLTTLSKQPSTSKQSLTSICDFNQ